jgi:AcrR family transcriptional regulator
MPKLKPEKIAERKQRVETAALALFRERGFHGVGLRDIAAAAELSIGNIYNYYPGKEPLFSAILDGLYQAFTASTVPLAKFLADCRFPDDLEKFGHVMDEMVAEHSDYLTLVYVDIAEFRGEHIRTHYEGLAERFRTLLAPRFAELRAGNAMPKWVDPAVAFTLIYMQFTNYFVVERLIGAVGHLGLDDRAAVKAIARLFTFGLAPRSKTEPSEDAHA